MIKKKAKLGGKDPFNGTSTNGSNYAIDGGIIDNLSVNRDIVTDFTYLLYEENSNLFEKIYGFFYLIFGLIG